jgi:hypothetical protein
MGEVYSSGSWEAKDGEEAEFEAAWSEFARWMSTMPGAGKSDPAFKENMGRVQAHVAEFTPSEMELIAQV